MLVGGTLRKSLDNRERYSSKDCSTDDCVAKCDFGRQCLVRWVTEGVGWQVILLSPLDSSPRFLFPFHEVFLLCHVSLPSCPALKPASYEMNPLQTVRHITRFLLRTLCFTYCVSIEVTTKTLTEISQQF